MIVSKGIGGEPPKVNLTEQFLHFVKETFGKRVDFFAAESGEVLQKFLLFRRQPSWSFHCDADVFVAVLESVNIFDSFAFHAKDFARLCAGGNFHFDFAVQRRHVDLRAQRGLNEADRYVADDVEIVAQENRMRLDLNDDVKIARRSSRLRAFAFAAEL